MRQPPTSDYAGLPHSAADHHAEAIGHAAHAEQLERRAREAWRRAAVSERRGAELVGLRPAMLLAVARYETKAGDHSEAIATATDALDRHPDPATALGLHELLVKTTSRVAP